MTALSECGNLLPLSFSKPAGIIETLWVPIGVGEKPTPTESQSGDKSPHSERALRLGTAGFPGRRSWYNRPLKRFLDD